MLTFNLKVIKRSVLLDFAKKEILKSDILLGAENEEVK
jgi:hypothetical protein